MIYKIKRTTEAIKQKEELKKDDEITNILLWLESELKVYPYFKGGSIKIEDRVIEKFNEIYPRNCILKNHCCFEKEYYFTEDNLTIGDPTTIKYRLNWVLKKTTDPKKTNVLVVCFDIIDKERMTEKFVIQYFLMKMDIKCLYLLTKN